MRTWLLLAVLLLTSLLDGEDLAPGAHKHLVCLNDAKHTYDVFLPKAYGDKPTESFPVLFISGPGGNPGFLRLEPWAERQEVVLVTINESKNGDWAPIHAAQKAVSASVFATLRLHHCLRFSTGHSGAAWASAALANKFGDDWAGVLFNINSQRTEPLRKHIASGYIAGTIDGTYPIEDVKADVAKARAAGNPVRTLYREVGHVSSKPEEMIEMLDWMLELERLNHPRLTPADLKAGLARLQQRITDLKALTDPVAQAKQAADLLTIDRVLASKDATDLATLWGKGELVRIDALSEPIPRHRALDALVATPWAAKLPSAILQDVRKRATELEKDKTVKADADSQRALAQVRLAAEKVGTSTSARQAVAQQFAMIAQRWPDTEAASEAKSEGEKLLESPKKKK